MIIDKVDNIRMYKGIHAKLNLVFDIIQNNDFSNIIVGKHKMDSDRDFILVNEYTTKLNSAEVLEAHRIFVDVQYMLEGQEIIEYAPYNNQDIVQAYDEENDYSLYQYCKTIKLDFRSGMFAVFFSEDLHMPGIINGEASQVKKVVFKVFLD